jgi:predicted AAA+ superfamily ATPase
MENSWLIFTLNRYSYSVKRQQIAPNMIYCIDTGMANSVGFRFSPNTGNLPENLVFLTLHQHTKEVFYSVTSCGHEVDFYLPERRQLIQVSQRLENSSTRERKFRALEHSIKEIPIENALILSDTNENEITVGGIPVIIQSISERLANQGSSGFRR